MAYTKGGTQPRHSRLREATTSGRALHPPARHITRNPHPNSRNHASLIGSRPALAAAQEGANHEDCLDMIAIIDDSTLMQECFSEAFAGSDADYCVVTADHTQLREIIEEYEPNLLVLNIQGLHVASAAVQHELEIIRASNIETSILVISELEAAEECCKAFELGCDGYFPASSSARQLVAAARLVLAGGKFIPVSMLKPSKLP
ncbi:MAG: hypothetical protein KGQ46_08910 [Hyphomicrobiales bacterium]|nr:hypothetical protein [Hyphomicrobiales bacterium]MDE2113397.1 response regulator transcription factor [Hyphomicrobiales bacterium]